MEEKNIGSCVTSSEHRFNLWIGLLFGIWYVINWGIPILIDLFIHQADFIPIGNSRHTNFFPFFIILTSSIFVLLSIFKQSLPIWFEAILIVCTVFLIFSISDWKTPYIENFITNPELKAACYQTTIALYNSSSLLIPVIWYIMRFIKQSPLDYSTTNKFLIILCIIVPILAMLSMPILDILKIFNLIPQFF